MAVNDVNGVEPAPEAVAGLLRDLATDDELRKRLETDPHAVLAEKGITLPGPELADPISLPTRDEIAAVAGAVQQQSTFRVGEVLPRSGMTGRAGVRAEYGENRPAEFGSATGEFGPPLEEGERSPAEFGPPADERERPPAEFGDATGEFGPPAETTE